MSDYLEEHYDDDCRIPYRYDTEAAGDEPFAKSRFEADYSIWYDQDFVNGNFRKFAVDIAKLLKRCAYSESFVDAAAAAAKANRITESNAAFLIYDFGFDLTDADHQLAASRLSDVYNRRAPFRFIASVPYVDASKPIDVRAIEVAKKKRVALWRVNRNHLEMITSVDVWGVECDGEKLVVYRGKRVDRTTKTEKSYADVVTAKDAMKRMVDKKIEEGFQPDTWPRGGFKLKS